MAVETGYSKIATSGSVFIYDTGDTFNSYLGIPVVNCATDLTSGYNVTVTEVTDGSIQPPFPGMRVYKFVTANNYNLYRQGGYYDGGGFAGSNPRPLILGRTSPSNFTTVGTGKYKFGMYVRGDASNSAGAVLSIDIGDRNGVSATIGTSSTWQLIQTNDSAGINDSSYPYDFFDISADFNMTFYVSGYGIWRNIGTVDSLPALQGYPVGRQYITYGQTRTATQSLIDISGNNTTLDLSSISFTSAGQITFDGTDDYIPTGKSAAQLGMYDQSYTAECLCYPTNFSNDRTMFGTDGTGLRQGLHLVFRSGTIYMGHYASDYAAGTGTLNAWNHIVYTFNKTGATAGTASIYKNGVLQGSGTIDSFIGTTNIQLGRWASTSNFAGDIAVQKIYSRALTASEVLSNFNHYKTRFNIT
jgi:hypothetical protein